jgi:prepilin-type N-terminal cleavage/methylation domain-containing protein
MILKRRRFEPLLMDRTTMLANRAALARYARRGFHPPSQAGFTLIELGVVIVVVALLLGALLIPLTTQVQATRLKQAETQLETIREALIGFALINGRLPCPDLDLDGLSDLASCSDGGDQREGILPWLELGVSPIDPWGRLFRYAVAREFTEQGGPGVPCAVADGILGLCDLGDLTVRTRGDDPDTADAELKFEIDLTTSAAAVVFSLGANGYGGTDLDGNNYAPGAVLGADENDNLNVALNPGRFYSRGFLPNETTGCDDADPDLAFCAFDDVVSWISSTVLLNRMVSAQQLP